MINIEWLKQANVYQFYKKDLAFAKEGRFIMVTLFSEKRAEAKAKNGMKTSTSVQVI